MHLKFHPAAFQNMFCHKENLYASFSLTKRLILAPWLWLHGNLRHCNCSLPQTHSSSALELALRWSLLWVMSVAQPAENIHFFWFFFFSCQCTKITTPKAASDRTVQLGQGRRPGPSHPAVSADGELQPVCFTFLASEITS